MQGQRAFTPQTWSSTLFQEILEEKATPWLGGECPVDPQSWVFIKRREKGEWMPPVRAFKVRWSCLRYPGDIIAYVPLGHALWDDLPASPSEVNLDLRAVPWKGHDLFPRDLDARVFLKDRDGKWGNDRTWPSSEIGWQTGFLDVTAYVATTRLNTNETRPSMNAHDALEYIPLLQALADGELEELRGTKWVPVAITPFLNPPSSYRRKPKVKERWIGTWISKEEPEHIHVSYAYISEEDLFKEHGTRPNFKAHCLLA